MNGALWSAEIAIVVTLAVAALTWLSRLRDRQRARCLAIMDAAKRRARELEISRERDRAAFDEIVARLQKQDENTGGGA